MPDVARAATSDDLDDDRADVEVCEIILVAAAVPGAVLVMRKVDGSSLSSLFVDITTISEDGVDSMAGVDEGSGGLVDVSGGWADEIDSGDVAEEVEDGGGGGGGGEELDRVRDGKEKVVEVAVKVGTDTVYH